MISIRYMVKDVAAATEFYTRLLGFELKNSYGPAMAIVAKDGVNLWLAGPSSSAAQPMSDGQRPMPGGWNRFVLQVEGLQGIVAQLRTQGVVFRNEILQGPGGSQILCEDPSGNPVELFQPRG